MIDELKSALRAVRARAWRGTLAVVLLALALAANTIVFSAADSFVLHRVPYADPDRLVEIARRDPRSGALGDAFVSAAMLDQWRRQTDLFTDVQGYLTKTLFLSGADPQKIAAADLTPGLIELLGARPRWGRSLQAADAAQVDPQTALISEGLAAERFGDPARAPGQTLQTAGRPLLVVGVMPRGFQFPSATVRIWRALDPRGDLAKGFAGVHAVARLSAGVTFSVAQNAVPQRAPQVGIAAGLARPYAAGITPLSQAVGPDSQRRLFLLLLGAAICLLLTACANVASLELAAAVSRARACAIQLALGASHRRLVIGALLEGLLMIAAAALLAAVIARVGAGYVSAHLPERIRFGTVNPIDLDGRALAWMILAAAITWLLAWLPVVLLTRRANVVELLKLEGPAAASVQSVAVRRVLTAAEVAIAVVLIVGTALYVRTYVALVRLEKGFDSTNVAVLNLSLPAGVHGSLYEKRIFARTLLDRLESSHAIVHGMWGSPPGSPGPQYSARLEVDGGPPASDEVTIGQLDVEPAYFATLGIALRRGRTFLADDPPTSVIVGESLAARLWPGIDPIGREFRWNPSAPWLRVVGVAAHVRTDQDPPGGVTARAFQIYRNLPAPRPPATAAAARAIDNGGSYGFIDLVIRVASRNQLDDALRLVRGMEPRAQVRAELLDDVYAARFGDRLMAARVIGTFGALAFVLAAAGVYGVMAFLVASRRREIGIRIALGADGTAIRRLILGSSLRMVLAGLAVGIVAALAGSRWIASQLFGVRPVDPLTWIVAIAAVVAVALLAAWQPARHATRINPADLLRV